MDFEITITHDRNLARRAVLRYMCAETTGATFAYLVFFGLLMILFFLTDNWSIYLSVLGVAYCVLVSTALFIYVLRRRQCDSFFDSVRNTTVSYRFTDSGLFAESELGSSNLKWEAFDKLLKFPEFWLIVYAKSAYMLFPTRDLNTELKDFIESKLESRTKRA